MMSWLGRSLLVAVFVLGAANAATATELRRVLLLHSFGPHFVPWTFYSGRFREELVKQSPHRIDLYEASLEGARFADINDQGPFVDYVRSLFAGRKLDLIVTMGAPAARFALHFRKEFFPSTPLVIGASEQRAIDGFALTANDVVVGRRLDFSKFVENILQVLPGTTHIAWAVGASPLEKFWKGRLLSALEPFTNMVTFEWFDDLPFEGMLQRVAKLPPNSAVFYLDVRMDAAGVPLDQERVLGRLHEVANAPIFSYVDGYLGHGIVGGPLVSSLEVGRGIAEVSIRVLNGEIPGSIKTPVTGLGAPIYDWRELQRWNIAETRLPAGSAVRYRESTVWERYRWSLMGTLAVLSFLVGTVTWLLLERGSRQKAEAESRRRLLEVIHLSRSAEVGALSASFAHDLSQPLVTIMLNADSAKELLGAKPHDVERVKELLGEIKQANEHATKVISRVKGLLKRTDAVGARECDLNEAIAQAAQILLPEAKKRGVTLCVIDAKQPLLVRADSIHLQQVILNLARNGMDAMSSMAADARRIVIQAVALNGMTAEVSVSDSGTGILKHNLDQIFDTFYTTKEHGIGLGLSLARTIVESCGGKIWAESPVGGGAVFHFTLPLLSMPCSDTGSRLALLHHEITAGEPCPEAADIGPDHRRHVHQQYLNL